MITFKNRVIDYSKPVEVYRCLNRKGFIFSVRQNNFVVAHTAHFVLKDCEFIINEYGKQKYVKQKETMSQHVVLKSQRMNFIKEVLYVKNVLNS